MRNASKTLAALVSATVGVFGLLSQAGAASYTWVGGTGTWDNSTTANWSPNSGVPNISGASVPGDTAIINTPGISVTQAVLDFQNDGLVQVSGAGTVLMQPAGSNNYVEIGNRGNYSGEIDVNAGATYNAGGGTALLVGNSSTQTGTISANDGTVISTAGPLTLNSGSVSGINGSTFTLGTLTVAIQAASGATASVSLNNSSMTSGEIDLNMGSLSVTNGGSINTTAANGGVGASLILFNSASGNTFSMSGSGSSINLGSNGELNVRGPATGGSATSATISGGTLSAHLISFDGSAAALLNFGGGTINVTNFFDGIYSGGGALNFTPGSTGMFVVSGDTVASVINNDFAPGHIDYNGVSDPSANLFNVVQNGTSVDVSLVSVPEPASISLIGLGAAGLLGRRRRRPA